MPVVIDRSEQSNRKKEIWSEKMKNGGTREITFAPPLLSFDRIAIKTAPLLVQKNCRHSVFWMPATAIFQTRFRSDQ
ncbi:hypothetical protein D3C76_465030 [compost metagenome]